MWISIALVFGLLLGFIAGRVSGSKAAKLEVCEITRQRQVDQKEYLTLLLRNLAQVMMIRNIEAYGRLRSRTFEKVTNLRKANDSLKIASLAGIASKYPYFSDFDAMPVKEYIFPLDACSWHSQEDLEQFYEEIAIFRALNFPTLEVSDEMKQRESKLFEKYCAQWEDTLFKQRVLSVMNAFYDFRAIVEDEQSDLQYSTSSVDVVELPNTIERRFGLRFKDTNQYGIFTVFHDDRSYETIYRSDERFEAQVIIDPIGSLEFVHMYQLESVF
jgi:hypothetical protein